MQGKPSLGVPCHVLFAGRRKPSKGTWSGCTPHQKGCAPLNAHRNQFYEQGR